MTEVKNPKSIEEYRFLITRALNLRLIPTGYKEVEGKTLDLEEIISDFERDYVFTKDEYKSLLDENLTKEDFQEKFNKLSMNTLREYGIILKN